MSDNLNSLRTLLHSTPSREVWRLIIEQIDAEPSPVSIGYAQELLTRWPDDLRVTTSLHEVMPPSWPLSRYLSLYTRFFDGTLSLLQNIDQLAHITHLDLSFNSSLSSIDLSEIISLPHLKPRVLLAQSCHLRERFLEPMNASCALQLEHLDLSSARLHPDNTRWLAAPHRFPELVSLNLAANSIAALDHRFIYTPLPSLTSLGLSDNPLNRKTFSSLCASPLRQKLHVLLLLRCQIDDHALKLLFQSQINSNLKVLDLRLNPFSADALLKHLEAPGVESLDTIRIDRACFEEISHLAPAHPLLSRLNPS